MFEFDPITFAVLLVVTFGFGWLTAHWRELF